MAADGKAAVDEDDGVPVKPAAAAPAKSKSGLVMMLAAVLVSAAASGGAAWFFASHGGADAADEEVAAEADEPATPAKKDKKKGKDEKGAKKKPKLPAQYLALEPAFVVNLDDQGVPRYLQIEVQVMGRGEDEHELEAVKTHAPRIRNALLLLFGQQQIAELNDRAGKERLQAQVLAEIQNVLKDETGKPVIEAVYFTSFVMQ